MNTQATVSNIRIWGRPNSICTQRVLWACEETQRPNTLELASATMGPDGHVDTGAAPYGKVNSDEYRQMNPNGSIPTIDDGGTVMWESNAIVCYLALQYRPDLCGHGDAAAFSGQLKWMSWCNEFLEPPLHTLVMDGVRLPPEQRDPKALEEAGKDLASYLQRLEILLSKQDFVSGTSFGIADIPTGCAAYRFWLFDLARPAMPSLERWLERLGDRKGFEKHVSPAQYHLK